MPKQIRITYLYPYHMNLYGDTGNILCLKARCEQRGISVVIQPIHPGDRLAANTTDLYFFGGGQDMQQLHVGTDLLRHREAIQEDIHNQTVALTICGGYQLFGEYFLTAQNQKIPGIGVFKSYTRGSAHRMIGNIIGTIDKHLHSEILRCYPKAPSTVLGFENHSGETLLDADQNSLCQVTRGYGNNYTSKQEGIIFQNAIGTYMHGSLLPKNPHLADYLIVQALAHHYQEPIQLSPLDDLLALQAHQYVLDRFGKS